MIMISKVIKIILIEPKQVFISMATVIRFILLVLISK